MPRVFDSLDAFKAIVGEEIGTSDWFTITQEQVNLFAEATHDHQWIHVDPERAANGPFGTTVAHGYLTQSLLPAMGSQIYAVDNVAFGVNYGSNKVRFPSPVPVGSRVRGTASLVDAKEIAIGTQLTVQFVIEIDGGAKPACIAEVLFVMAGE